MYVETLIESRGPFLIVDADGDVSFRRRSQIDTTIDIPLVVVNVAQALARFKQLAGDRQEFTSHQLQQVSGMTYRQVTKWTRFGLLPSCGIAPGSGSGRLYGIDAAFIGGLLGGLRRAGQPTPVLKAVAELCREPAAVESEPVEV